MLIKIKNVHVLFFKKKKYSKFCLEYQWWNCWSCRQFLYLGVTFLYNGSMKHVVDVLNQQALRTFNHLLSLYYPVKMDVKTKLTMFDTLVEHIVLYC